MIENLHFIALSRQMALSREMDVVANNLANMNTTSFKRQLTLISEQQVDVNNADKPLSFVFDVGTHRDLSEGEIQVTGNPLDIAISGDGFLVIETEDGERYTRNGNLRLSSEGELTTASGQSVLGDQGRPIVISSDDPKLIIAPDGTITGERGVIGRIALVRFDNPQAANPVGNGLYKTDETPQAVEDPQIQQGMLESSNVKPVVEMTRMIEISRAYTAISNMLKQDNDLRRNAIRQLGRTPAI